ncbi:MAG: DUF1501 domain-containing protein [Myxococcales bacterium]|nr:DUF1501 domain-containing protein [Myxococcales bacterium]
MADHDRDDRYEAAKAQAFLRRRDLLKAALVGGAASSLVALPMLHRAFAQRRPDATAKRVLILYFGGGVRSSVAFHASPATRKYNPWGVMETAMPTPFSLGKLLDDNIGAPAATPNAPLPDELYTLPMMGGWRGTRVPRLREIAHQFSVVGTWNPARGDHYRGATEEPTGSPSGLEAGLLSRLGTGVDAAGGIALPPDNTPTVVDGSVVQPDATVVSAPDGGDPDAGMMRIDPRDQIPAFHVNPGSSFGHTNDATSRFAPVPLFGVDGLPGRSNIEGDEYDRVGQDWARDPAMRARLDQRRLRARVGWGRGVVEQYAADREGRRRVGERLTADWIDVRQTPNEARGAVMTDSGLAPLTNGMLHELFSLALGPDPDGATPVPYQNPRESGFYRSAMDFALAVRLLQLGSPAIVVEMGGFDTHSGERRDAPSRFRFVGRIWSTLQWLLSRMPEPGEPGKSMLDRTLVLTMSEMSRDPGTEATGFNNGEGSDHGSDPSCYYLAHAIMGGGVQPGRHIGAAPATTYVPPTSERLSLRRLHATALWALGLEFDNPDWGYPDVQPITQLFTP